MSSAVDPAESGVQAARNQYLVQMLEDLGPAENRGTGIGTGSLARSLESTNVALDRRELWNG